MNELEAKCYLTKKGGANNSDHTCRGFYLSGRLRLRTDTWTNYYSKDSYNILIKIFQQYPEICIEKRISIFVH